MRKVYRRSSSPWTTFLIIVLIVALFISLGVNVHLYQQLKLQPVGGEVKVTLLNDRDYFPAVHPLLEGARRSIHVVMYELRYYKRYPGSAANRLAEALARAASAGADVRVVLEHSRGWNVENAEKNRKAGEWLEERGVDVRYDHPHRTTHDKLIIVDGRYVVVGSTNWTHYALSRNHEASVLIESPEVAAEFEEYFQRLWEEATDEPR